MDKVIFCPRDPDLNDVYDMIRWARQMHPHFPTRGYDKAEIEYTFEALETQTCQVKRGQLEKRLRELGLRDNAARKKRWRDFYRQQLQLKIAKLIKTHPNKAKRIIARLKQQ